MAFDAHKNFAISAIAVAPVPAASGTAITVTTGEGTRFPAVPFNAVVCPAGVLPTPANAEVVRVTVVATDVLTITRAQESSSARTIVAGDLIFAAVTAKTLTDVEPVYCRVYHNANQSLTTATLTILAFNSEREDSHNIHDNTTNNSRLTPPAGVYIAFAVIRFASNAVGDRGVSLKFNGTTYISAGKVNPVAAAVTDMMTLTPPYRFNGTDYVEVEANQSSGGALNVTAGGNFSPEFGLVRVGI